ncbi:hypothetical protein HYV86_06390 [Candidatus Woesearchaeota archaeon]|nr:hypothetical protein [Candidatus Woesearchaeota archaeon]
MILIIVILIAILVSSVMMYNQLKTISVAPCAQNREIMMAQNSIALAEQQGELTGQAIGLTPRETISFSLASPDITNCKFEQVDETTYRVSNGCKYIATVGVNGPNGHKEHIAVYLQSALPNAAWQLATRAERARTYMWEAKTSNYLDNGKTVWQVPLEFKITPGIYTYRASTVNSRCHTQWKPSPTRACEGFLEGAFVDYTLIVE